jgi:hypothetical protein
MAGSLDEKTFPKINVTRKNEFKMPDINLEYIKNGSMSSFINQSVDDFSEQQIKEEADFDS